ncbi:MAG: hypothetical protein BIFFINMI_02841 [Phycisphaerae bacterium]|nr:hypothetical protein [Phycisphaerae bacterium]
MTMDTPRSNRNPQATGSAAAGSGTGSFELPPAFPGYIAVPAAVIGGQAPLDFCVSIKNPQGEIAPCLPAGQPPDAAKLAAAESANPGYAYVTDADYPKYRLRAESGIPALLADEQIGPHRFRLAFELLTQLADELLESSEQAQAGGTLDRVVAVCKLLAELATGRLDQLRTLAGSADNDWSAAQHMVSVAIGGLRLARALGLDSKSWDRIALACWLHDIGMAGVPASLQIKEGRLSEAEWQLLHDHPARGREWLANQGRFDAAVVAVPDQHHEQHNGKGYPQGLSGDSIHPWARLCAIVDTYDQLVNSRPFRDGLTPQRAVWLINAEAGERFDPMMCVVWQNEILEPAPQPEADGDKAPAPQQVRMDSETVSRILAATPQSPIPLEGYLPLPPLAPAVQTRRTSIYIRKDERRNFERFPFVRDCRVRIVNPENAEQRISFWASTVELSRGGLRFAHARPIGIGQVVSIFLPDRGGTTGKNLLAMVAHCRMSPDNVYHVGCRFDFPE